MAAAAAASTSRNHFLQEWTRATESLLRQLSSWIEQEPEWSLHAQVINTQEERSMPPESGSEAEWRIHTPAGEVRLEATRQDFLGRRFVEVYAWPTLRRVQLLPKSDEHNSNEQKWKIRTDSGIFLRQEWNRENFVLLIQDLIEAE